jgi:hypothetical protein
MRQSPGRGPFTPHPTRLLRTCCKPAAGPHPVWLYHTTLHSCCMQRHMHQGWAAPSYDQACMHVCTAKGEPEGPPYSENRQQTPTALYNAWLVGCCSSSAVPMQPSSEQNGCSFGVHTQVWGNTQKNPTPTSVRLWAGYTRSIAHSGSAKGVPKECLVGDPSATPEPLSSAPQPGLLQLPHRLQASL